MTILRRQVAPPAMSRLRRPSISASVRFVVPYLLGALAAVLVGFVIGYGTSSL